MTCRRCCGMMVADRFLDAPGRTAQLMWRCVSCGDMIDPVILINRMRWPHINKKHPPRQILLHPVRAARNVS